MERNCKCGFVRGKNPCLEPIECPDLGLYTFMFLSIVVVVSVEVIVAVHPSQNDGREYGFDDLSD